MREEGEAHQADLGESLHDKLCDLFTRPPFSPLLIAWDPAILVEWCMSRQVSYAAIMGAVPCWWKSGAGCMLRTNELGLFFRRVVGGKARVLQTDIRCQSMMDRIKEIAIARKNILGRSYRMVLETKKCRW